MERLFVTGASGFVGSRLIAALGERRRDVVALSRDPLHRDIGEGAERVEFVLGDLLVPDTYRRALAGCSGVLHLAAATGKATPKTHHEVNAVGTQRLLEQCRALGVGKFLFVSSIAVKFPDKRRYYYAQAKESAERAVRASGLAFTILRPTLIVGPGSPGLAALAKLAELPVMPIFGDGRARVQPLFVDDLVKFLLEIVEEDQFRGETLDLGGAQALGIEAFLQEIRTVLRGDRGPTLHIPLRPLLPLLAALETVAYGRLPFTVGQLATFRFDSVAEPNDLYEHRRSTLCPLPRMLTRSLAAGADRAA
jgi:NADH dehydrogenase